ncbi:sensor histidine kinase [Pengzhenrongella sp.]|jgi:signal transduction histidine kinase|uniref:sensor histidine kinase n=1 Tax=Pengzhenrongella sp. TaxID=2888820 RepID=UPI002F9254FA
MRSRLTVTTVLAVLVGLLLLTGGFALLLSASLDRDADATLKARAEAVLASVTLHGERVVVTENPSDETLDSVTWVLGRGRSVVLAPPASIVALTDVVPLAGVAGPTFANVSPRTRLLAVPVPGAAPNSATVVVSISLEAYQRTRQIALLSALVLDLAIVLVLAVVTRWLVGAALRPVDRMTRQAQDWLAHDVDRRFEVPAPVRDEIGRLGSTLNDLLGRLGASLRHERRLTEEIAHELRTPLARARAEAEVSGYSADVGTLRAALAAVVVDIDELSATVDTLLRSTREPVAQGARTVVADAVRAALDAVHPPEYVVVEVADAPGPVPSGLAVACEESLVRRILAPQLENAARHAATRIRVGWSLAGDRVLLEVLDDGPGLDADETDRVFGPGERGRGAAGTPGSGLGLALARRLARSCGGDVTARAGPGGRFTTSLPVG